MSCLLVTLLITSIRESKMTLLHWTDTVLPFSCPQPFKLFSFFPFETFKPVKTCHHQWHTFAIDVTWCLPVRMVLLCLSHRWSRIVLGPMKGCLFREAPFFLNWTPPNQNARFWTKYSSGCFVSSYGLRPDGSTNKKPVIFSPSSNSDIKSSRWALWTFLLVTNR